MQIALLLAPGCENRCRLAPDFAQWIAAGMVHGRGGGHRRWQECLHLIRPEIIPFQPQGQIEHVLVGGAGMSGNKVRDQILFLAGFSGIEVEQFLEPVKAANSRFHHHR